MLALLYGVLHQIRGPFLKSFFDPFLLYRAMVLNADFYYKRMNCTSRKGSQCTAACRHFGLLYILWMDMQLFWVKYWNSHNNVSADTIQRALNTWRGRLQHFLQLLKSRINQKMIVIWFLHLLKSNKFPEFHRCGSKNVVKIWCQYLKPLLSNSKLTKIYHSL